VRATVPEAAVRVVEVFADVACPFTHTGLRRISAWRSEHGLVEPLLRLRAWPLELVNGASLQGATLAPEIAALRRDVAPDLFASFDPDRFPLTSLPAMISEAAAYRRGIAVGERFSLAVRTALFEDGLDIADPAVLRAVRSHVGAPPPIPEDERAVMADYEEGKRRHVAGSPHFFTADGSFFCPSLQIEHGAHGALDVTFDVVGFQRFLASAFASRGPGAA
jgi:2-hydroxychromene-2-carboxylate isomerase